MRYLIIIVVSIILVSFGCKEEKPREFTSIEVVWNNGDADTLNAEDGFIIYRDDSFLAEGEIIIYPWSGTDIPIRVSLSKFRYIKINYLEATE